MQIIGGHYKGRRLIAPKGLATRPTASRARESLFNILSSRDDFSFEGARIIDLFAGSGALGLEAMSRGAAFCLFVDNDHAARGAIRDNIDTLALIGMTKIHRRSALNLGPVPASINGPFDLAFLDPPYGEGFARQAMGSLHEYHWLKSGALVIVEQGAAETPVAIDHFEEIDRRRFGAAMIGLYHYETTTENSSVYADH